MTPDVVWFSNVPAPYRFPMWRSLAHSVDLLVCFMARNEPGRRWDLPRDVGFDWTFVASRRLSRGETHLYLSVPGARRAVERADVVVIGGWESPANWRIIRRARRSRTAVVLFYESTVESHRFVAGPVAALRRKVLRSVDVVLTVGPSSRDAVIADGVPASRVVMGRNSIDDSIVLEARRLRAERFEHEQPADRTNYLFVGRLIPLKNVDVLLRAFARVRQPGDALSIVGEGTQEHELRDLVAELELGEVVTFAGYLTGADLAAQYAAADALVLPSSTEVWGMVVQEALDSGLSAVVSEHAGIVGSLANEAAVVVSGVDESALAASLVAVRALSVNKDRVTTSSSDDTFALVEAARYAIGEAYRLRGGASPRP